MEDGVPPAIFLARVCSTWGLLLPMQSEATKYYNHGMAMPERSHYQVLRPAGYACQVLVIRENGYRETWAGFADEKDAQAWIALEMAKRSFGASKWGSAEHMTQNGAPARKTWP